MAKAKATETPKGPTLLQRLQSNSTIKETALLAETKLLNEGEVIPSHIYLLNAAWNGDLFGGYSPGVQLIVGDSRMFKTGFCITAVKAYFDKYPDAVAIWYDSEFGAKPDFFASLGVDGSRILHTPITNIEMLRADLAKQLDLIQRGNHVIIIVDSLGSLASQKEVADAVAGNDVTDMTRAKVMNSLFRIITPVLNLKAIPFFAIAHSYDTMEKYARKIISGGKKQVLAADTIWMLSRTTEKDDKKSKIVDGYTFNITVDKSRFVKEKSLFEIDVRYDQGINIYSGLLALAVESGHVQRPTTQIYKRVDTATGELVEPEYDRDTASRSAELWAPILADDSFNEFVRNKYKLAYSDLVQDYEPTPDPEAEAEEIDA